MQSKRVKCGQFVRYVVTQEGVHAEVFEASMSVIHISKQGATFEAAKQQLAADVGQHGLYVQAIGHMAGILKIKL
jgi:hypothetical protein